MALRSLPILNANSLSSLTPWQNEVLQRRERLCVLVDVLLQLLGVPGVEGGAVAVDLAGGGGGGGQGAANVLE